MNPKLVVVEFARNMLFDSSDEEENVMEKINNYAEETVPNFSDRQFKQNFRITPTNFEELLRKVHSVLPPNENLHGGQPKTTLEKEVMIMMWYLGNMESFRSVSERFGVTKSTCWDILYRTCKLLLQVNTRYKIICWPSQEKQRELAQSFAINGFPGIIGCIDGCHIKITAPRSHPNSYINRKNYHSVLLQGVCDNKKLFINAYAGEAGSIHDMNLFRRSDLYTRILTQHVIFYEDSHLLGDLAYKLHTYLMVGFKNNGNLTLRQKNFNVILSKGRAVIENAFALLKGRFRRLKYLETVRMDLISLLIISSCILHNICILNGDLPDDIIDVNAELEQLRLENPNNLLDIDAENDNQAIIKRNNIVNNLRIQIHIDR